MEIEYSTRAWNDALSRAEEVSGKSPIIEFGGRKIVVREINGIKVPFYLSTGSAGKKNVPAGKWYPFFGIGPDGWINKGSQSDIVNHYGIKALKDQAEELDRTIGDIRGRTDIPKVGAKGRHMKLLNFEGKWGVENGTASTSSKLRSNIEGLRNALSQRNPTNMNPKDISSLQREIALRKRALVLFDKFGAQGKKVPWSKISEMIRKNPDFAKQVLGGLTDDEFRALPGMYDAINPKNLKAHQDEVEALIDRAFKLKEGAERTSQVGSIRSPQYGGPAPVRTGIDIRQLSQGSAASTSTPTQGSPAPASPAPAPSQATPTLTNQMNPGERTNWGARRLGLLTRGALGGFMRGLGSATQLGRNSASMQAMTDLQRGMFGGGPQAGLAFRNLGRAGIIGTAIGGGMLLRNLLSDEEAPKTQSGGSAQLTPDAMDYRKKASKNILGRLSFDDKNTFSKDDLKYMMSQQDSKVTSAISKLSQGEGKKAYVDALKQVATGQASASTLNNMIVKAMGPDAKASKGPIYLPGTYKLGDKSYMMAIDNTEEGSPRLVRMAIGGKELEFDPYKPEQTK